MKKAFMAFLVLMVFATLILSGCDVTEIIDSAIVCKEPYMRFEAGCCLDKDSNDICDEDDSEIVTYCGDDFCPDSWVGDGYCDSTCYNEECEYDGGDCDDQCAIGCPDDWITDGTCDTVCYTEECEWDGGDCDDQCAAGCPDEYINDGYCDSACFVEACNNDGDDCADYCAVGCSNDWITDGMCDEACNVEACNYDGGDC